MASTNPVEKAWNKTRGDNPDFSGITPDFRAKLQQVYGAALAGQPESGIAGLEEFEAEIRRGIKSPDATGTAAVGTPTVRDAAAVALGEQSAEPQPKGSGAQEGSPEKAARDAAAKNASDEHGEEHSPRFPSAARPKAAEAPANTADTETATSTKRSKAGASKRTSTKTTSKKK